MDLYFNTQGKLMLNNNIYIYIKVLIDLMTTSLVPAHQLVGLRRKKK